MLLPGQGKGERDGEEGWGGRQGSDCKWCWTEENRAYRRSHHLKILFLSFWIQLYLMPLLLDQLNWWVRFLFR